MLVPRQNTHKCNSATRGLLVIGVVHGTHTQKHTHTQVLRQPRHIVTLRYALRVGLGPFITWVSGGAVAGASGASGTLRAGLGLLLAASDMLPRDEWGSPNDESPHTGGVQRAF